MGILFGVSLLIFGLLHRAMPRSYAHILDEQVFEQTEALARQLEVTPQVEWEQLLLLFAAENQVSVTIQEIQIEEISGDIINIEGIFIAEFYVDFGGNEIALNFDGTPGNQYSSGGFLDLFGLWNQSRTSMMFSFNFEHDLSTYVVMVESQNVVRATSQMEMIFLQLAPYVFFIILIVSIVTSFFYTRFLSQPVVEIAHQSMKLVQLDGSWDWKSSRRDEIGMLGGSLKTMYDQLIETLAELREANDKLQNEIDYEREIERRRRDFFTAISHELKTPVTILKGELEGMILNVGKFKDRDKYLQEAYGTSESIEKLIREIMMLAKLDTIHLEIDKVNLSELITDVLARYEPLIDVKKLEIMYSETSYLEIKADNGQIQTALSNIIGNAVKHSPSGKRIWINLETKIDKIVLTVENEGINLDESEIDKLWEPFYRADKSRNRDTGGSGLGLYIVKSILDLHGFECRLENTPRGVLFVLEI